MNTKDFLRLGVPLGQATRRVTDFISKFILGGGDKSRLHEEVAAIVANPSAFLAGMPPRTQIGPPTFFSVSSISPSEGANFGSMALPVALSQITNRPAGQCAASCFTISRASAVSSLTRFQILPFGSQNRANAHRFSWSVSRM